MSDHDHVPPRSIFAVPRPRNLITVPACAKCHAGTSKDDEYFQPMLAFNRTVADHPDIRQTQKGVLATALRGLRKPEALKFTRAFLRTIKRAPIHTPAGIYLGHASSYDVETTRFLRVVERTVRGLFFHERGAALGLRVKVNVLHEEFTNWDQIAPTQLQHIKGAATYLHQSEQTRIGRAFRYAFFCTDQNERVSAWLLTFYDTEHFLALTAP